MSILQKLVSSFRRHRVYHAYRLGVAAGRAYVKTELQHHGREAYIHGLDAGYDAGYDKGCDDGIPCGYTSGYDRGHADGCEDGWDTGTHVNGFLDGWVAGRRSRESEIGQIMADQYALGHADGCRDGWDSGHTEGCDDGGDDMIQALTTVNENGGMGVADRFWSEHTTETFRMFMHDYSSGDGHIHIGPPKPEDDGTDGYTLAARKLWGEW